MSGRWVEAGIVTADADELARFYTDGLRFGLDRRLDFPQGLVIRLRSGDAGLKLFQPAALPRPGSRPTPWHAEDGFAYAALHVDDVDTVIPDVSAAGGTVLTPPTTHRPGARFALIADPEGNVWELLAETTP